MANFTKRAAEVFQAVQQFGAITASEEDVVGHDLSATLTPQQLADMTDRGSRERKSFLEQTDVYFTRRQALLNRLIEELGSSISGDRDTAEIWRRIISELKVEAMSSLDTLLSGIDKPSERALSLKWKISSEEDAFNAAMFDFDAAGAWQALALLERDTRTLILTYDKEWKLLLDKSIEVQAAASSIVRRLLENLLDSPASGEPYLSQLAVDAGEIAKLADDAGRADAKLNDLRGRAERALGAYERTLDGVADKVTGGWRLAIDQAQSDIALLKGLQSAEIDGLHRIFKDKRRAAQDFAREPATRKAAETRDKVTNATIEASSGMTDGMRADLADLFIELNRQIEAMVTRVNEAYAEFEREFKGRFLDSVDDDTVEQLASVDDWDELRSRFRDRRDPDTLRFVRSRIDTPEVDVERQLNRLANAVNERSGDGEADRTAFGTLVEGARSGLVRRHQGVRDELQRTCDRGIAILEGPDLLGVLSRQEIERSLRS